MKKPSILFMNRSYPPTQGATGRLLKDLARAFAREGWHVTVVTTVATKSSSKGHNIEEGIHVVRIKTNKRPRRGWEYALTLIRLAFKAKAQPRHDIVVSMTDPPLSLLAGDWVSRAKKSRHIHWCQDLYPDIVPALHHRPGHDSSSPLTLSLRRFEPQLLAAMKRCERVIVIGRCMARRLSEKGVDLQRITFIPNWPNLELIAPRPSAADKRPSRTVLCDQARQKNATYAKPHDAQIKAPDRFRVLYAGTLGLLHPTDTLLDAIELLQTRAPMIEFVFAGEGPGYEALSAVRTQRQLDNLRLIPPQPANRLDSLMKSGDVHVMTMDDTAAGCAVPCKLYSAFAAGRPCVFIGPIASEAAKVLDAFGAGRVIAHGKTEALVDALLTYLNDEAAWFSAQTGALQAAQTFLPKDSMEAWIKRATQLVSGLSSS